MNKDDMILISVDDHIVEPPDMFKNHLPKKYLDEAPRLVHNPDGSDTWQFRDTVIPNVALNAVAGRPKEEYGLEPQGLDEIRPGCYDVDERVKDMNAGGILASICFPSFPGLRRAVVRHRGSRVLAGAGAGLQRLAHRRVVRRLPGAVHPDGDAGDLGRRGVRRRGAADAKKGVHALTFTENPAAMGYPSFHDDYWTPLWEALVRHRHRDERAHRILGPAGDHRPGRADGRDDHAAADEHRAGRRRSVVVQADQEVPGPQDRAVARAAPGGSRTSSSGPTAPTRCTRPGRIRTSASKLPSEVFREHFLTCFISDQVGVQLRNQIGIDNICWEADYPHSDSMWPGAPEELRRGARPSNNVPDDEINKMTYENAMRWYSLRPVQPHHRGAGHRRRAAQGR